MNWRPIRTAPRDKLILLSCMENEEYPPYVTVGRWIDCPHSNELMEAWKKGITDTALIPVDPCWHDGYIGIMEHGGACRGNTWEFRGHILFRPTHWMPLPKGIRARKIPKAIGL